MNSRNLKIVLFGIFLLIVSICITFYKLKCDIKAKRFYRQGLELYNNEKYSDAYYNFRQIKPFAYLYKLSLIKECQCAINLSDKKSAISKLNILIKLVKDDSIRPYLLYKEATLSQEINKDTEGVSYKKYRQIANLYPKSDYGIASAYKAGKLIEGKDNHKAKELYVKYLKNAPDGKYSTYALESLEKFQTHIHIDDYEIIANAYLINQNYLKALEKFRNTPFEKNWYNISKCYKGLNKSDKEKETILEGLALSESSIDEQNIQSAINRLVSITRANKIQVLQDLYSTSKDRYIFPTVAYMLAESSSSIRSIKLYEQIAENYKKSVWASNSIWEIFWYNYSLKRYKVCEQYALEHISNYSTSKDAPRIAYWYGRVLLKEKKNKDAKDTFYKVIKDYPLSYYAFLSAKQLKISKARKMIVKKPIANYSINSVNKHIFKDKLLLQLANYNDFETIEDLKINDDDVKSWIYHKKENYPKSILIMKDKINNISKPISDNPEDDEEEESEKTKISFSDYELKFMYPVLYSDIINEYAQKNKQSPYLFLSLVREESHFNKSAKSSAGAIGLSQIMRGTANFIEGKSVSLETLLNEEENIRIGLKYFKYLVEYFKGDESLAILSYNAGPGNINKWLADPSINSDDLDTFVENIPYIETKNYIKKILSSYWVYLNIYSPKNRG